MKLIFDSKGTDDESIVGSWFTFIILWAAGSVLFLAILAGGLGCIYLAFHALTS